MRSNREGTMRSRSVMAAAVLLIGLSGCHSWESGSSTQSSDAGSSLQSGAPGKMSEAQAREDLGNHGYSNVSDMHRSGNDWMGSAIDSSGKPVNFDVDEQGVIVIIP